MSKVFASLVFEYTHRGRILHLCVHKSECAYVCESLLRNVWKKNTGEQNIPPNVQAWQLEKENTFDPRTLEGGYYKAKCNVARLR